MKILITGASGFIGKKLLDHFSSLNHEIVIHVRNLQLQIDPKVKVFCGELIDFSSKIQIFKPDYVFHLAGSSNYPSGILEENQLLETNVKYGNTLISILQDIPDLIFVNFATSLSYDQTTIQPYTYYALTKANFLLTLNFYSLRSSIRIFNLIIYTVYGNGDTTKRAINYIIDSLNSTKTILMSPGEQQIDFIHVDDVICLCEELLNKTPKGRIEDIHVGTGKSTTLKQAAKTIEKISQKSANIDFGAIPYRKEEKMVNVAFIETNRFWKSKITFEKGIITLLNNITTNESK